MSEIPKIYGAISNIIAGIGVVSKDKKNQQQGFSYRGIDDVMNALQPVLASNRVFIVPEVIEQTRQERQTAKGGTLIYSICTVRYTFYAEDGSNISAIVVGEGMDSGDKATNKAMSIAFKYACFQVFCIPTEEMKDPDNETPDSSKETEIPIITTVAKPLTEKQITRLYAIAGEAGYDSKTIHKHIEKQFKLNSVRDLNKAQYDWIIEGYENAKAMKVGKNTSS